MQTQPCSIEQVIPVGENVPVDEAARTSPTLEEVLKDACEALEITDKEVKSKIRKHEIVSCRMIFCYAARKKTNYSLKSIGDFINRHYTTVIHSCQTINDHFDTQDERFLADWNRYLNNSKLFNEYDFK